MTSIHIITHCWSVAIPDYAKLLTAQLSWLYLHVPKHCRVHVTIVTNEHDDLTCEVAGKFRKRFREHGLPVSIWMAYLPLRQLFRRAISRNQAALRSNADIVIFSDADMLYGSDCLDTLARVAFPGKLVFPRITLTHRDIATGEQELAMITPGEVFCNDRKLYVPSEHRYAAGNCQIVRGETARATGYLNGPEWAKWQVPRDDERPFPDTREDVRFRQACGGSLPVELPCVYRMRHVKSTYEVEGKRGLRMWQKGAVGK